MDAKGYLDSYRLIQTRINVLMAEVERLRAEAESVSINIDGMPRGTATDDKLSRLVAEMADLESTLTDELSGLYIRRMKSQLKSHRSRLRSAF